MRIQPIPGFRLHITNDGDIWLNSEGGDYSGLRIGAKGRPTDDPTRDAFVDATLTLTATLTALKRLRAKKDLKP
jgi:hypothetical protein